ncbi:MAG: aminotransferase-like domain-containing protein [Solirubrobacteraceae bacterium]
MAGTSERLVAGLGEWHSGRGPLFERLADGIVQATNGAALPSGGELPAERALAAELGVSRATVVAAYRELRERGLAVTRHGSGTVMRNAVPIAAGASSPALAGLLARRATDAPLIDLSVGAPELDDAVEGLTVSGSELPRHANGHGYVPAGWQELRAMVAELLSARGAQTSPEEVLITNGAQEAISLAVTLAAADGRRIAVESPGYPGALDAIARAGGQALAVERDAAGLRVDRLKQLLGRQHVHAVYVAPSCNNPTGARTAAHRRERLAALASEHELTVVEDSVLDELRFDGEPGIPLWAYVPDRVLAAGSLSKVAWGGLRVGWLRAPRPVILRLARVKGALNLGVGALDQLAALQILDGYDELCRRRRAQAAEHMGTLHRALRRELPEWDAQPADGGWSLWMATPTGSGAAFAQAALRHGVAVVPGGASSPDGGFPEYVRVCYGPAPPVLEEAARRLAAVWADFASNALPVRTPAGG